MPILCYSCKCGNVLKKFFRQAKEAPVCFTCAKCGEEAKKTLSAPSSSSKITVDNGFQARAVEIMPDIVEINRARSEKNYKED